MTTKNTISERTWNANQSWNYEWLGKAGSHSVRVVIRRNAYDDQSFAKVDRFDGSAWKTIVSKAITFCECVELSYTDKRKGATERATDLFIDDRESLLREARLLLGVDMMETKPTKAVGGWNPSANDVKAIEAIAKGLSLVCNDNVIADIMNGFVGVEEEQRLDEQEAMACDACFNHLSELSPEAIEIATGQKPRLEFNNN